MEKSMRVERVAAPLREQVIDQLRRAIMDNRLAPGQRLVERELIEQIGVSRTTIREALRQLAAEGLVETIPQKGAIVATTTVQQTAELYQVRAMLEELTGRQFVQRASDAQVKALRRSFEALERTAHERPGDIRALLAAMDRFYVILCDGAANATVRTILTGLKARVMIQREASLSVPGRVEASVQEIRALVEAAEARNPGAAARACRDHVNAAAKTLADAEAARVAADATATAA